MAFTERELGRAFKLELENQKVIIYDKNQKPYTTRFKVYLNKPVQTHTSKFKRFWKAKKLPLKDIPPSQPEIDMIIIDHLGIWRGIELKAVKKTKKRIFPSYYIGLGQALAYLLYGMDEVALWQCFDGDSMKKAEISEYNDALTKIIEPMKHFMDSTILRILEREGKPRIQTAVFYREGGRDWQDGIGIYRPEDGKYRITCRSSNPFLTPFPTPRGFFSFNQTVVNRVKAVREFLELQKTELWDDET